MYTHSGRLKNEKEKLVVIKSSAYISSYARLSGRGIGMAQWRTITISGLHPWISDGLQGAGMMLYMHIYYCALRGLRAARFCDSRAPAVRSFFLLVLARSARRAFR
jgi:hypothetical protein